MSLTYLINKFSDLSNFSVFTCHAFCDGLKFVSQAGHSRNDYRNLVSLVIIASNELPNLFSSLPISHRGAAEFHYVSHFTLTCLLYTSDAADEEDSVDLGGRRIIKKKKR